MAFAALSGVRVVAGSIVVPTYGLWAGDVSLATADPVPDDVALSLGNLTLRGHVYRQSLFCGERKCRLVAGAGGWRKTIGWRQYSLAGGVNLSLVLGDAARECGERVNVQNDYVIGTGWVREKAAASRQLRLLAGSDWYVDPSGVTQIAAWPTKTITSAFTVIDQDGAEGRVTIATEDYASWMPGCTFRAPTLAGPFTSGGTMFKFDGDGEFRLEVLTQ